jgi:hypothetical protein
MYREEEAGTERFTSHLIVFSILRVPAMLYDFLQIGIATGAATLLCTMVLTEYWSQTR